MSPPTCCARYERWTRSSDESPVAKNALRRALTELLHALTVWLGECVDGGGDLDELAALGQCVDLVARERRRLAKPARGRALSLDDPFPTDGAMR